MELPLFPLHLVLFPGRPLPLHVFEPRYRQMLAHCLEGDRCFGVIAIRSGCEVGDDAEIFEVGTIARIQDVTPLPDGRYDVVTRGCERFRVLALRDDAPYPHADVELIEDEPAGPDDGEQARQVRQLLLPYLAELGAPPELLARIPSQPDELAWLAAAAIQIEVPCQQRLLECASTSGRLAEALRVLRREAGIMRHLGTVGSLRPMGPGGAELN